MLNTVPVTVVVPVFNGAGTIADTLRSIAGQTRMPASVIVVDDASTDGSADIARESDLPGLQIFTRARNAGVGAARNNGAASAQTEWLAFLDADDAWEPTFLEEMVQALVKTKTDFATSGGVRERFFPHPITYRRVLNEPAVARDRTKDFWHISWRQWASSPTASVIRRSLFEQAGGFPEDMSSGEDITLFARLWLLGRFCFVNKPLYRSVQREQGLTAKGPTYHDVRLMLARVGQCLLVSIRHRRPGTAWFTATYSRMVVGRHRAWLAKFAPRLAVGRGKGQPAKDS